MIPASAKAAPVRVIASCWTTAGDAGPLSHNELSPFDLRDRVRAAAAAGFTGFGFADVDLAIAASTYGLEHLASVTRDAGIVDVEVEMLYGWFAGGEERRRSDAVRRQLLTAAEVLGARHLKVGGDFGEAPPPLATVAAEFRRVCEEFAPLGVRVGFELMPFANLRTVADGRALLELTDHDNGGLFLDLWHMARAGVDLDDIAQLDAASIVGVELDDADHEVVGTLVEDTLQRRRLCGEGDLDVAGFIRAVRATGFDGPWGVEILSDVHRKLSLEEQVRVAFITTSNALTAHPTPTRRTP